jgi:hypothetical protein
MKRAVLEHFKNGRGALIQTLRVRALCRKRRRQHDGRSWNGRHKIEDLKASERLGDQFEKFIDYAICVVTNTVSTHHSCFKYPRR